MRVFEQALHLKPDSVEVHYARAQVWLRQGDFNRGWTEAEWRWRRHDFPPRPFAQPLWEGAPLAGRTILLHAEQGLGDTLQFIRYVPLVKERGGRVIVECQPALLSLLASCAGIDRLVARGSELPPFDTHTPLLSLPRIFGTTLATVPAKVPYLSVDAQVLESWRRHLGSCSAFKVGIAWQGNPDHINDYQRSVPLQLFAPLAQLPGVQLFSLQKGRGAEQLRFTPLPEGEGLGVRGKGSSLVRHPSPSGPAEKHDEQLNAAVRQFPIIELGNRLSAFQDTGAALLNLDLVITVDTAVAHCAGALGVPVWVLLRYAGDWRWLTRRDDSPWYPSMRLFRQTEPGNWKEVFERLTRALEELVVSGQVSKEGPIRSRIRQNAGSASRILANAATPKSTLDEPVGTRALPESAAPAEAKTRREGEATAEPVRAASPDGAEFLFHEGETLLARGEFAEAVTAYQRVLRFSPDHAMALNSLGIAFAQQGKWDQAAASFREATRQRSDYAEACNNLGFALARQGKLAEAESCYQQALRIRPLYPDALNNLGLLQRSFGKLPEALAYHRQALAMQPDFPHAAENIRLAVAAQGQLHSEFAGLRMSNWYLADDAAAWNELGARLKGEKRLSEAISCFQEALRPRPDFPEALNDLGIAFRERGNSTEALAALERCLALRPDFPEARNNLGTVLESLGKFEEAKACYDQVLQARPNFAEAHNNLGVVLNKLGRYARALQHYQRAVALKPAYVEARVNMAHVLLDLGQVNEAVVGYDAALRLRPDDPEAHLGRAQAWLRQGNYADGWPEYEWRWRRPHFPPRSFAQPVWDGSPLASRTILLHAEQGLGDTLQFIRFATLVKERGGEVIVECQESLMPLLATCAGIDRLVKKDAHLPPFDTHAPLLSLPRILQTTLTSIPATVPYLFADPEQVRRWGQQVRSGAGFKVGLAWQGNPSNSNDRHRSVPLIHFEPLLKRDGVQFFSVQHGPGSEQLPGIAERYSIIDLGSSFEDFQDTAAALRNLDLVITVDSAVAHCAGALGVHVWVLLPFASDWRWLSLREDSPWYPSMRLFRQQEPGNWDTTLARVAGLLHGKTELPGTRGVSSSPVSRPLLEPRRGGSQ